MGESAELMLNGILCQYCGVFINRVPKGYPVSCSNCEEKNPQQALNGLLKFLKKFNETEEKKHAKKIIFKYCKEILKYTNDDCTKCAIIIQNNFDHFYKWCKNNLTKK